jgi:hypothetical protein
MPTQRSSQQALVHIDLARGQAHSVQLARGSVLGVTQGRVTLTHHVWLDSELLVVRTPLGRGACHEVSASGWVQVNANEGENEGAKVWLRCADAAPIGNGWLKRWYDWVSSFRFTTNVVKFGLKPAKIATLAEI